MTEDWRDGYRRAVAEFLRTNGMFVDETHYPKRSWNSDEADQSDYDEFSTVYGWADYFHQAGKPFRKPPEPGCPVVSVDFESMREQSLSQFENTFTDNKFQAGVEVRATCACGKYTDKWLRWEGTVGEILPYLLNTPEEDK